MILRLSLTLPGYQAFQQSCIIIYMYHDDHSDTCIIYMCFMFLKLEQLNFFREYISGFIKTIINLLKHYYIDLFGVK